MRKQLDLKVRENEMIDPRPFAWREEKVHHSAAHLIFRQEEGRECSDHHFRGSRGASEQDIAQEKCRGVPF
jgi:hypothetical protein